MGPVSKMIFTQATSSDQEGLPQLPLSTDPPAAPHMLPQRWRQGAVEVLEASRGPFPPGLFYKNTEAFSSLFTRVPISSLCWGLGFSLRGQADPPKDERGTPSGLGARAAPLPSHSWLHPLRGGRSVSPAHPGEKIAWFSHLSGRGAILSVCP